MIAALPSYYGSPTAQKIVLINNPMGKRDELLVSDIVGKLDGVASLALASDGRVLVLGTVSGKILVFDLSRWQVLHRIDAFGPAPLTSVSAISISNDGTLIVAGASAPAGKPVTENEVQSSLHGLRIWDVASGRIVASYDTKNQSIREVAWNPRLNVALAVTDSLKLLFISPASKDAFWFSDLGDVLSAAFSKKRTPWRLSGDPR